MELVLWIFLLIVGLALLVKGADWFVDGSAGIARKCKIPPLVIGLTVVAFGTSAPELCVSVASAIGHSKDAAEIAIGNVLGSNIVNVLLILGLAALFHALPVKRETMVRDIPVLLGASGLLIGLGVWGGALEWWDGLIFLVLFLGYTGFLVFRAVKFSRTEEITVPAEEPEQPKGKIGAWFARMKTKVWFLILLTLAGLVMVVGGGTLLVESAKKIAAYFEVPERVIALTVVAIGTSLPELVTSVVAARKGETDIAVGNVIGSNLCNILLVAGISSLIFPLPFSIEENLVDAIVALGACLLLYFAAFAGKRKIGKAGGAAMLVCFAAYYVYLFVTTLS